MGRLAIILTIVGVLIGAGAGYLWWGAPLQRMRGDLAGTRAELRALEQRQQAGPTSRPDEMTALQQRIKALETDLERERQMRSRLETIVSQGQK